MSVKSKKRNISLFLGLLSFIYIICFSSLAISADNAIKQDRVEIEKISELIVKIEEKWEKDYERHFKRNFVNYSQSVSQIADKLAKINQQTGTNTAVIWAIPQDKQLRLLLVTPGKQLAMRDIRGADRQTLSKVTNQFFFAINNTAKNHSTSYLPAAKQLYKWIISPFESYLEAENIDSLLLCTGPGLRSLPFAALHDGERFLIEKYSVTRIPAFNLTDTNYNKIENKQILAMGASEFTNLPSLPGVEVELSIITPKLWSGRKIINQDFTVENLKTEHKQGKFDIIHLATHSEFRSGFPSNSYIQFFDRRLNLDQIKTLDLDNPSVDLLVLSACSTAIGDEDAEFGFSGLAIQAGVKSALASLWAISDTGTVALMSEFYQQLQSTPIKTKALRQAQIAMLRGEVKVEESQLVGSQITVPLPSRLAQLEAENLSHPFYWAGFTIIGNPW